MLSREKQCCIENWRITFNPYSHIETSNSSIYFSKYYVISFEFRRDKTVLKFKNKRTILIRLAEL